MGAASVNRKQFAWCEIIVALALGIIVIWSISVGDLVLPVIAVIVGLGVTLLLRRRIEEVTVDERVHLIHEKASTMTVQVFALITVLVGFALIALSRSGYADLSQSGFTLVYSACALLILHLIFRHYYRRKYGG
jgi:uncharacterized membrane protein